MAKQQRPYRGSPTLRIAIVFLAFQSLLSLKRAIQEGPAATDSRSLIDNTDISSPTTNTSSSAVPSDDIIRAIKSLSAEEEDAIWDAVHGREFQYPLSCPGYDEDAVQLLRKTNSSVIVAYHVGMQNNWKEIVRDQLHTLHRCGLGRLLSRMFVTYTDGERLRDLRDILQRYSFARDATLLHSFRQPIEGTAINALHQECISRVGTDNIANYNIYESGSGGSTSLSNSNNHTVAFYFHTKGTSRFVAEWRDHMDAKFSYPYSLYWRKYMEYFTIERPQICIEEITQKGKYACGVNWKWQLFGGNFWAIDCLFASTLQPQTLHPLNEENHRWEAEGWINRDLKEKGLLGEYEDKFVSLHNPPIGEHGRGGLYSNLILPETYSDYSRRWSNAFAQKQGK